MDHLSLENISSPPNKKSKKAFTDSSKAKFFWNLFVFLSPLPQSHRSYRVKPKVSPDFIMVENIIHCATELLAAAGKIRKGVQAYLAAFVFSCPICEGYLWTMMHNARWSKGRKH